VLHGEGAFLQRLENVLEVVGDLAHDEAVEQRHPAAGAGAGKNAPPGQEAEIVQQRGETFGPLFTPVRFGLRDRLRHASPSGADIGLARGTVAGFPDMAGDVHAEWVVRLHADTMSGGV